ncbi:hypothetical protein HMI56_003137 [Coelomomyces lativittatus]|nr:hypothetical protein HMI56_003137 [Coelomomyces lativittatus]
MEEVSQELITKITIILWTIGIDSALCVIGALLNLLLLIVILWKPKKILTYRTLLLILNLAFSDLVLSFLPLQIIISEFWVIPEYTLVSCQALKVFERMCSVSTITSVMLLAMDRYILVVLKKKLTLLATAAIIFTSWCFSILVAISPFMVNEAPFYLDANNTYCGINRSTDSLVATLDSIDILFWIYLIITLIFYVLIVKEIRATVKGIRNVQSSSRTRTSSSGNKKSSISQTQSETKSGTNRESKVSRKSIVETIQSTITSLRRFSIRSNATTTTSMSNKKRNTEFQLSRKTIILGSTHFLLYLPTALISHLTSELDPISMGIVLSGFHLQLVILIFDPLWSFFLDPHIKNLFKEMVGSYRKQSQCLH